MELALNLICLALASASVLVWTVWRRSSDSRRVVELGRGWIIIGCILALLVPAISITDDLAQVPFLGEGVNLQDVFKASKHSVQSFTAAILVQAFFSPHQVVLWKEAPRSAVVFCELFCCGSNIEKRPPPYSSW